ncbi:YkgJ family cysteine cluster protein [Nitratidesulfovibrio vulgaris]|uniref:YkgJ family cysteine cluster protein n=1 Tax=Nitratidesulfovibrio vulgaris TaxID=881 RepID=UPI0013DF3BC6|nr:YkgJ family cysteine cluster protein [Nitratidesulfovibrio vulgaris]
MISPEERDATQAFLDSLPELEPGESFRFSCHPGVRCFNACCSDLTMPLTPYDVLRLRRNLGMDSETFIAEHARVGQYPDTGFPLLHLRMSDHPLKLCPFVSDEGCTVYPDRSSACRTYPLGRATREDEDGNVVEQFFVVQEEHCRGFEETKAWTSATWLQDQGLEPYYRWNDAYMSLMARQRRTGTVLGPKHATMCLLAFYQLDRFADFVRGVHLFSRLDVDEARQERILADEEERLGFALEWAELVLFGDCATLRML